MKTSPESVVGMLLATSLGIATIGCDQAQEAGAVETEKAQAATNETLSTAKEKGTETLDPPKKIGWANVKKVEDNAVAPKRTATETSEDARKAGEQMEAILKEAIGEGIPASGE